MHSLGSLYKNFDFKTAIDYYKQALEIYTKTREDPMMILALRSEIGTFYALLGDFNSAVYYYKQELEFYNLLQQPLHPLIKMGKNECLAHLELSLFNLGIDYKDNGDYNKAIESFEQALEFQPQNDSIYRKILFNLGIMYFILGNNLKAINYFELIYKIYEKTSHGNDNESENFFIAEVLFNLGLSCTRIEDFDKSKYYLEICCKKLDENHKLNAELYLILGEVYKNLIDNDNAKRCYEKSLEIHKKFLAENVSLEPKILKILAGLYFNLASIYGNGEKNKAIDYCEKALEIYRKVLPEDHQTIQSVLLCLKILNSDCDDINVRKENLKLSLDNVRKTSPNDHRSIAQNLYGLGEVYEQLDAKKYALDYYLQAYEIYKKILPANHSIIADLISKLEALHRHLGDNDKANFYNKEGKKNSETSQSSNRSKNQNQTSNINQTKNQLNQNTQSSSCCNLL